MRAASWRFAAMAALLLAGAPSRAQTPFAPEPATLWPGPMQGATPRSLSGATVLDAAGLAELVGRDHPVLIDVANAEPRPAAVAASAWMPVHRSIPDAVWLPGAGTGKDRPGFAAAFAARIAAATGGDKSRPIAVFCHARRWGSWNAAKRLTDLGYRNVYWYPGGSEGWAERGATKAIREDGDWRAAGFDASSAADMPEGGAAARR